MIYKIKTGIVLLVFATVFQYLSYGNEPLVKNANPKYVFQIDTTGKGNWMWGDNGIGYFGKGTVECTKDDWFLEWQCY